MKTKTCLFVGFAAVMLAFTSCKEANLFDRPPSELKLG